ncbi:MAG TPA: hypothetical protein PL110_05685 [Candidatus Eremiobacteraeota bacterium]|nr:hypothetical protein [Candidatus Eremiobacteraeota bacterium]
MFDESLDKLKLAKKELEDIARELGFDMVSILGDKGISLNETFPSLLQERAEKLSKEDLLRLFKAFFTFQGLSLVCLETIIMNSLDENVKKTAEKRRAIENEIWKNYFQKLMGYKDTD